MIVSRRCARCSKRYIGSQYVAQGEEAAELQQRIAELEATVARQDKALRIIAEGEPVYDQAGNLVNVTPNRDSMEIAIAAIPSSAPAQQPDARDEALQHIRETLDARTWAQMPNCVCDGQVECGPDCGEGYYPYESCKLAMIKGIMDTLGHAQGGE